MTDSSITVNDKGQAVTYAGPDAVNLFRAKALKSALGLLSKGIQPTRGFTNAKAFTMATEYTGKKYKRGQHDQARADLDQWIAAMTAALPIDKA